MNDNDDHAVAGAYRKVMAAEKNVERLNASRQDMVINRNYSAGMADVRQGGTIGLPAKTLVNASMTLPPFLRMVEM